jgi:hypothetical protein
MAFLSFKTFSWPISVRDGVVAWPLWTNVFDLYGHQMQEYLKHHNLELKIYQIMIGEQAKSLETFTQIVDSMTDLESFGRSLFWSWYVGSVFLDKFTSINVSIGWRLGYRCNRVSLPHLLLFKV